MRRILMILVLLSGSAHASEIPPPHIVDYGEVETWKGPIRFCREYGRECMSRKSHAPVELTPEKLSELDSVNRQVNHAVKYATDRDLHGVAEWWTYPMNGKGDCEDYVLRKRRILERKGWPKAALFIALVLNTKGDGHAVLIVRTTDGDYVLDDGYDVIRLWHESPYRFVMRQSETDPRRWLSSVPLPLEDTAILRFYSSR